MKHLFIINPAAGNRDKTGYYRAEITRICEPQGLDYRIEVSGARGECRALANHAARSGEAYRIYSCGGDGTLNEIVSGVAGYENVAITTLAAGSGNDFCRLFSEPEAFTNLSRLLDAEEAVFDLIRCNEDYSINICSVGFDARIGTDVIKYKRLPLLGGSRAYAFSAVMNILRGIGDHYIVECDGKRLDGKFTLICVCNGRYYGGGFQPVPGADPADGKLEVLLVDAVSRLQVAKLIGKYKKGLYKELPQLIRHVTTDRIKIICDSPSPLNLDGELLMAPEADIRLAEEKVRFFYPKGLTWQTVPAKVPIMA